LLAILNSSSDAMAGLAKARLYYQTLRHLRPVQICGRLLFKLARPRPDRRPPPPLRAMAGRFEAPARRAPSLTGPDDFVFLNESHLLEEVGWDNQGLSKLWRYNLHYFDDLNAKNAVERKEWHEDLIADWIEKNQPGQGSGWEPYPTSLRMVSWIKWALTGNSLADDAIASLAVQARWLTKRLEYHLLGNHLFANAKALVFAGAFFAGPEAKRWLRLGGRILAREIDEQILPDGGHFELSTMYDALAFEDVLDLINLARAFPGAGEMELLGARLAALAPEMGRWLSAMSHPDYEIGFFNDAAFGIAPPPLELKAYAGRLGLTYEATATGITWLKSSGYVRMQAGSAVLLADVAPVAPDYLPGHAHADTLSFELSIDRQRVLVNSGTSIYARGPERERQRGTSAHNTVVVDGKNSSEVWASFRVARRARPVDLVVRGGAVLDVGCAHDGYTRLPGGPVHRRRWQMNDGGLRVTDAVGVATLPSEARYHFHPEIDVSVSANGQTGMARWGKNGTMSWTLTHGTAHLQTSSWHPEFGLCLPNRCLVITLEAGQGEIEFSWGTQL
jgi:uncharacterized heparinase superfamily protein